MSLHDRAAATVVAQLATPVDCVFSGIRITYVTYRINRKYTTTSSTLGKIRQAPYVQPFDLRSILSGEDDSGSSRRDGGIASSLNSDGGKLVIVRGTMEAKSAVEKGN